MKPWEARRSHLHTSGSKPLTAGFPKFTFSFSFIRDLWGWEGPEGHLAAYFSVGIYLANLSSTTF